MTLFSKPFKSCFSSSSSSGDVTGNEFSERIGQPLEPGTITIGKLPEKPDPNKPILVFVQGLNNNSAVWYEENNMYELATADGFETVFVELYDSGGKPKCYWENGKLLASQLEEISEYFDGKKLAIIGYSKGAIDAQVALIHEGKHQLVSNVIAIASPHLGSELADLAHSKTAGWLASLIGANNEGTKCLQTGRMLYFRSITDNLLETNKNSYFTIAGSRAGPIFSLYSIGGLFVPGPSDGVVTVASTYLPYGEKLVIGNWNHQEIRHGSNILPVFNEFLIGKETVSASLLDDFFEEEDREELSLFARGGPQTGKAEETFYVENNVDNLVIDWISSKELTSVALFPPGSKAETTYPVTGVQDNAFFHGAWHHCIEVDSPEKGGWTIQTYTKEKTAYLFLAKFDSMLNKHFKITNENEKKMWRISSDADPVGIQTARVGSSIKVSGEVNFFPVKTNDNKQTPHSEIHITTAEIEHEPGTFRLPNQGEGTYNTSINIEGTTPTGDKFQRTLIKSIYIDELGKGY